MYGNIGYEQRILQTDMETLKHRFSDHKINSEIETLIIGTFNPVTIGDGQETIYFSFSTREVNFLSKK